MGRWVNEARCFHQLLTPESQVCDVRLWKLVASPRRPLRGTPHTTANTHKLLTLCLLSRRVDNGSSSAYSEDDVLLTTTIRMWAGTFLGAGVFPRTETALVAASTRCVGLHSACDCEKAVAHRKAKCWNKNKARRGAAALNGRQTLQKGLAVVCGLCQGKSCFRQPLLLKARHVHAAFRQSQLGLNAVETPHRILRFYADGAHSASPIVPA